MLSNKSSRMSIQLNDTVVFLVVTSVLSPAVLLAVACFLFATRIILVIWRSIQHPLYEDVDPADMQPMEAAARQKKALRWSARYLNMGRYYVSDDICWQHILSCVYGRSINLYLINYKMHCSIICTKVGTIIWYKLKTDFLIFYGPFMMVKKTEIRKLIENSKNPFEDFLLFYDSIACLTPLSWLLYCSCVEYKWNM